MNSKYRLAQRRRTDQRAAGRPDHGLLGYLRAAAAIARPRSEPDPTARRNN